jgi:uncharacterized glyoxalase superfamily protein PhnB
METDVKPIPEGYHAITPYLTVEGASRLIEFLEQAFQAETRFQMPDADGRIRHAELRIGDSMVMIAEAHGPWKAMPASLYLYVPDTDAFYRRAIEAGGTSILEPADQFYGDRNAGVKDPSGNIWYLATHVEDVSPEEMKRRHELHLEKQKASR